MSSVYKSLDAMQLWTIPMQPERVVAARELLQVPGLEL